MSAETAEWLNTQVLVDGSLGRPWWASETLQADNPDGPTIYDGPVPVADVTRRLFSFTLESAPVYVAVPASIEDATGMDADGNPVRFMQVDGKQGIYRSDTLATLGIFAHGYTRHQYTGDMMGTIETITGDRLTIQSAGLLKGGAQAWCQVAAQGGTILTPGGVEFRPYLLGFTSADGSLATGFTEVVGLTVCDNTMAANRARGRGEVRAKHTRNSLARIHDQATALAALDGIAEEFAALVADECATPVTAQQWDDVIAAMVPMPDDAGRSRSMAQTRRDRLADLAGDPRVAPWAGTAFGLVQLFNTDRQHNGIVRNVHRAERNMSNTLTGQSAAEDAAVREATALVLASA